jgi:hypothetical protein
MEHGTTYGSLLIEILNTVKGKVGISDEFRIVPISLMKMKDFLIYTVLTVFFGQ